MFQISSLKELACEKFRLQLQKLWVSDTLSICVREVYAMTRPDDIPDLRRCLIDVMVNHRNELIHKPYFHELVRENGDFAIDLLTAITDRTRDFG